MAFGAATAWKDREISHEYPGHERGVKPGGGESQADPRMHGTLTNEDPTHITVRKAHGGHVVSHHFKGGGMHEHVFASGGDMLAHVAHHMGVSGNEEVGGGPQHSDEEKESDG